MLVKGASSFLVFYNIMAGRRIDASVNWVIIGLGNGLSPVRRQAITWFSVDVWLAAPLATNFSESE